MTSPHRVCLLGFSDFERRALALQFRLAASRTPAYELVATPQEARYLVVDADAAPEVQRAQAAQRLGDAVWVGNGSVPAGALARLRRPIDALSLLRELDAAVARRTPPAETAAPPRAVAAPAVAAPAARSPVVEPRRTPLARPVAACSPSATVPALLDSQLSELADLFPDRAAAEPPAKALAKDTPCDALLVDDSEIALRFLETKLGEIGLRSCSVSNSEEALARLAEHDFSYVFLDVELGAGSRMDGLTLCRHIKQQQRGTRGGGKRAPVVALVSAHASQTDRVRGSLAGCDAYLGKPLVAHELAAVVSLRRVR